MNDLISPSEMYGRAKAAGLTISELTQGAGIAVSTFVRWKRGTHNINVATYGRLKAVVDAAEERQRTGAPQPRVASAGQKRSVVSADE